MDTVLFACVHNAGRSQMTAAWFNKICDRTKASADSGGAESGQRVHPEVVQVHERRRLPELDHGFRADDIPELNLEDANIVTFIWAAGYNFDFSLVRDATCVGGPAGGELFDCRNSSA